MNIILENHRKHIIGEAIDLEKQIQKLEYSDWKVMRISSCKLDLVDLIRIAEDYAARNDDVDAIHFEGDVYLFKRGEA